jgi:hypothetical protein
MFNMLELSFGIYDIANNLSIYYQCVTHLNLMIDIYICLCNCQYNKNVLLFLLKSEKLFFPFTGLRYQREKERIIIETLPYAHFMVSKVIILVY